MPRLTPRLNERSDTYGTPSRRFAHRAPSPPPHQGTELQPQPYETPSAEGHAAPHDRRCEVDGVRFPRLELEPSFSLDAGRMGGPLPELAVLQVSAVGGWESARDIGPAGRG
jgi:hypothetical protein